MEDLCESSLILVAKSRSMGKLAKGTFLLFVLEIDEEVLQFCPDIDERTDLLGYACRLEAGFALHKVERGDETLDLLGNIIKNLRSLLDAFPRLLHLFEDSESSVKEL